MESLYSLTHFRQRTTRRIKGFWRCISRCSCRESIPTSSRGRQRLKSLCYSIYTSQSWEVTVGSRVNIGDVFYRSRLGRGGDLLTERFRNTHTKPKWWTIDVYSSTWGRGGDVC